jgi:hypothetical protein
VICPLEPAWGTWADWVNAGAAVVMGIILIRLNGQTNRIAKNANETNAALAALQAGLAEDGREQRRLEKLMLLAGLHTPLALSKASMEILKEEIQRPDFAATYRDNERYRAATEAAIEKCRLPLSDETRAKLHLLDSKWAATALRLNQLPEVLNRILTLPTLRSSKAWQEGQRFIISVLNTTLPIADDFFKDCLDALEECGLPSIAGDFEPDEGETGEDDAEGQPSG